MCINTFGGQDHLMFAIDGTVVSDELLPSPSAQGWVPVIEACTCSGTPEDVHITAMAQSTVPRAG